MVSVALQLPQAESDGTSRLTDKFPSDTTLWMVIRKFESSGGSSRNFTGRGAPIIAGGATGSGRLYFETPVIQIMGRELASFTDLQKTLAQLGFNSGSALLRMSFRMTETPLEEAMTEIGRYFKDVEAQDPNRAQEGNKKDAGAASTNGQVPVESKTKEPSTTSDTPSNSLVTSHDQQPPSEESEPSTTPQTASNAANAIVGPSDRPIAVFAPPSSSTPKAAQQAFDERDYEPTVDHAKIHQQRLKASGQNQRLLTDAELAAQAEAQAQKAAQIKDVKIKVRFPDQSQVEAPFSNVDTARTLYEHVQGLMRQPEEPFSLTFSTAKGPKQIPRDSDIRLIKDLGMAGRVLVNFVWENGAKVQSRNAPTLRDEYRQQAREIEIAEVKGVEVEEQKIPTESKDKGKESGSRKPGVPKWLKLPGKK